MSKINNSFFRIFKEDNFILDRIGASKIRELYDKFTDIHLRILPIFSDDDFGSSSFGLPPCSDFFEIDRKPGENCDNSTIEEIPEIRYPDPLYERLFAQIWSDFQYKLNQESQLYGIELDPLDVDAKLPEV